MEDSENMASHKSTLISFRNNIPTPGAVLKQVLTQLIISK